jgi:hypothetical protein
MPQVGFEPVTPAFERAKTVHAVTVIGRGGISYSKEMLPCCVVNGSLTPIYALFKDLVPTAQKTHCISTAETNRLMSREIITI